MTLVHAVNVSTTRRRVELSCVDIDTFTGLRRLRTVVLNVITVLHNLYRSYRFTSPKLRVIWLQAARADDLADIFHAAPILGAA